MIDAERAPVGRCHIFGGGDGDVGEAERETVVDDGVARLRKGSVAEHDPIGRDVQPAVAEDIAADAVDSAIVVTGSREANASINGLKVEPIRLPQNVRVLDEELIDRNGFTDLSQLYDLAGGMARQNSFGGAWDAYAIRGFTGDVNQGPDLQINRFNSNRGFNARRDVATVESFQVLKGPASALSGKGEPGGSINIVTKAPRDEFHASADASYGSFDTYRGAVDFGGPVGSGFGARVIGVYQQSNGFRVAKPTPIPLH